MKNKILLIAVIIFTSLDIITAFFISASTVLYQTFYGLSKIALILIFIYYINVTLIQYRFLKIVLAGYWFGLSLLYIINAFLYNNMSDWLNGFNEFGVLSIVFTCSTLGIIIFAFKRLG